MAFQVPFSTWAVPRSSTGGGLESWPAVQVAGTRISLPLGCEAEVSLPLAALQEERGRLPAAVHPGDPASQVLQGLLPARLSG